MYGSDCADVEATMDKCDGLRILDAVRRLSEDKKIERKILYKNAKKLFRL